MVASTAINMLCLKAQAGLKAGCRLAQALVRRPQQVVVLQAMAYRETAGLLLRHPQVGEHKPALLSAQ